MAKKKKILFLFSFSSRISTRSLSLLLLLFPAMNRPFSLCILLAVLAAVSLLSVLEVSGLGCGGKGAKNAVEDGADDAAMSSSPSSSSSLFSTLLLAEKEHHKHHHHRKHHDDHNKVKHPWFCHDLACPRYRLLNESDGYETRELGPTRWVTTDVEAFSLALATTTGFQRLFAYIAGANEDQEKIEMTAPVLTHVAPGAGPFCKSKYSVSFFVGEAGTPAPRPSSEDVYVRDASAVTVFVASKVRER